VEQENDQDDKTGSTAIVALLARGAEVHNGDYKSAGISSRSESTMPEAKSSESEKSYVEILRGIMVLIDAGAKAEPKELNEWISRSARTSTVHNTPASSLADMI
jgi:hypothetical protein